jgi:hypothetical protein
MNAIVHRPTTLWTQRASRAKAPLDFCVLLLAVGFCGLMTSGCRSLNPVSDEPFASVRIDSTPAVEIRDVAVKVFEENGYQTAGSGLASMIFEKKAQALVNLAYGDWMGDPVWIRVKASIVPVSDRSFRLQCDAFRVRDKGMSVEDEVKLKPVQSGPYQKLLDEVARRLNGKPGHAA